MVSVTILILVGLLLMFWGWKIMSTLSETKTNKYFRSWWTERLRKEDTESYRIMNGGLFAVMMFAGGLLCIVLGVGALLIEIWTF
jgi:hypothetical protein